MTTKVIQWATGNTGRLAVRAVARRPELHLVGVRVYDPAKAGRDAGEVCGTDTIGVITSDDRAALIDTAADVVLFMGSVETDPAGCFADVIELLASGKNVIATGTAFIDPRAVDPTLAAAIAGACEHGNSTFLGLGIFPGFVPEVLPAVLSRLSQRVDRLVAREVLSYAHYPSHELMFDVMGFGAAPDDTRPTLADPGRLANVWAGTVAVLTESLGLQVDRVVPFRDVAVTDRPLDVASGHIPAGTIAAMRLGVRIECGRTEVAVEHITRMSPELAPQWPTLEGYEVEVDGEPSMRLHLLLGIRGEDHSEQGCLATAMHAVHAIPAVIAAAPGILNLASVPAFNGADAFG